MWHILSNLNNTIVRFGIVSAWTFLTLLYFFSINQVLDMCKKYMSGDSDEYTLSKDGSDLYNGYKVILFAMGWVNVFNLAVFIFKGFHH